MEFVLDLFDWMLEHPKASVKLDRTEAGLILTVRDGREAFSGATFLVTSEAFEDAETILCRLLDGDAE